MVVSAIAIIAGILGLVGDACLVMSDSINANFNQNFEARFIDEHEAMNETPGPEYSSVVVRTIWGVILLFASAFVFYGAIRMKDLVDYNAAMAGAVVAMVPCVGPCCLLGIPFGLWAFVVLRRSEVKEAFQ